MVFTVDKFLNKQFNIVTYNCWDFVREVWLELTGVDIGDRTPHPVNLKAMKDKFAKEECEFMKLETPRSPCIVMMQNGKIVPHVGVFYKNKILHIREKGVEFQTFASATSGFNKIGFYTCRK